MSWLFFDPTVPDTTADTSWLAQITIAQVIGVCVVIGLVIFAVRKINKAYKPVQQFLEDWNGEQDRKGVAGRPGVMARLGSQDEGIAAINASLSDVVRRREMDEAKTVHDRDISRVETEHVRDIADVKQHLARHDVQLAGLGIVPPGPHHTVTTVTTDVSDAEHRATAAEVRITSLEHTREADIERDNHQ